MCFKKLLGVTQSLAHMPGIRLVLQTNQRQAVHWPGQPRAPLGTGTAVRFQRPDIR